MIPTERNATTVLPVLVKIYILVLYIKLGGFSVRLSGSNVRNNEYHELSFVSHKWRGLSHESANPRPRRLKLSDTDVILA